MLRSRRVIQWAYVEARRSRYSTQVVTKSEKFTSFDQKIETFKDIFSRENISFEKLTFSDIFRAIVVLRICSLPGFADNAVKVFHFSRKCLGKTMFSALMRPTIYNQFVAGDSVEEIRSTVKKLSEGGLVPMLAVPIEDAHTEDKELREVEFENNLSKIKNCIGISCRTRNEGSPSLMQLKLTAMIDYDLLCEITTFNNNSPIPSSRLANWIAGGFREKELSDLFPAFTKDQLQSFTAGVKRAHEAFIHAERNDVSVLVDAEYTWINPALNLVTLALMRIFNKTKPVVWNTYQAYLKETRQVILDHARECHDGGVLFAYKLVRGAYLIPETEQAGEHPAYICDNIDMTNQSYDSCVYESFLLDPRRNHVMIATHNENSVRLAAELLRLRGNEESANVSFGQLYGMADYMSYTLGKSGYKVYKSLPYGNVDETLLYLCRRAKENTLFLTGIRKERRMLYSGLAEKLGLGILPDKQENGQ